MAYSNSKTPVIVLAFANDDGRTLRQLDQEQKELRELLRPVEKEGKCQLRVLPAATAEDVIQAFQEYRERIRIFHYGGHSDIDAIFFKDAYQKHKGTQAENLANFLALQGKLELIFLNSCLSLPQARQYQEAGVKAVLATNQKIGDAAARKFAKLFYTSLAAGASILDAYREAEAAFQVRGEDPFRGFGIEESEERFPWKLFPENPGPWSLPLVAKHLTRIPSTDLETEFLGREADMQRLKEKLENTSKVVLMNGLGGIGKTVLATAYVQQYGSGYDHLAWINRGENLIESVALNEDLADTLGLPFEQEDELDIRFRRVLRKLHQLPGQNLLVIDNAQGQVAQRENYELLPGSPNWRVLLTSRLNLDGFDRLALDTLEPEACQKLFRTYFKGECTEEDLVTLLKEIDYHTLTVELMAKLLNRLNNLLSVSGFTQILRQKQLDDPDLQEKIWTNHSGEERGIYIHLMKAFELTRLTEREVWLLKQFVVLPVERYPVATLADFLQGNPFRLNKVLNSLAKKGWLTLHEDKTFSIHRLIRQVLGYQLSPNFEDLRTLVERMIQKMNTDVYSNRITTTAPWLSYAIAVEVYLPEEKQGQVASLQNNIALTFRALGQYEEALGYHIKALAIREEVLGDNHPDFATSYNNIALTFYGLGRYEEALDHDQKALAIREEVLDDNHPDLATSYNNIAASYRALGQYEEALGFNKKALSIRETILDHNHPSLANSYNNIANTYLRLGQYEEALDYYKKALAIKEEVLDNNNPSLANSYNDLSVIYRFLGKYEKALIYCQKALAMFEEVMDVNHPSLATSYNNLAACHRALKQYEEALVYDQKALAIREEILNASNPSLGIGCSV